ncbi:hypothetical protein DFH07DRAFT_1056588, partial [Mycena maculata]
MASALHIQEMLDAIFNYLQDSPDDLKSCSLVSRSFCRAAQSLLFRSVRVTSYGRSSGNRLTTMLASSPHIIQYIHVLDCDVGAMTMIARICWTNLCTVTFRNFPAAANYSALERLVTFVTNTSLCTVTLANFSSLERPWLWRILSNCNRLNTLEFRYYQLDYSLDYNVYTRPDSNFLRIGQITLTETTNTSGIAIESMSPEEFSALMHIRAEASDGPDLIAFLQQRRHVRTSLFFTSRGLCMSLVQRWCAGTLILTCVAKRANDLRFFAGLRCIQIHWLQESAALDATFSESGLQDNRHHSNLLRTWRLRMAADAAWLRDYSGGCTLADAAPRGGSVRNSRVFTNSDYFGSNFCSFSRNGSPKRETIISISTSACVRTSPSSKWVDCGE